MFGCSVNFLCDTDGVACTCFPPPVGDWSSGVGWPGCGVGGDRHQRSQHYKLYETGAVHLPHSFVIANLWFNVRQPSDSQGEICFGKCFTTFTVLFCFGFQATFFNVSQYVACIIADMHSCWGIIAYVLYSGWCHILYPCRLGGTPWDPPQTRGTLHCLVLQFIKQASSNSSFLAHSLVTRFAIFIGCWCSLLSKGV